MVPDKFNSDLTKSHRRASIKRNLLDDLGMQVEIRVKTDASAAKGIASRRGAGKVRHIEVSQLWVQDKVGSGDVQMENVLGSENPGDALTKHMSGTDLMQHLDETGLLLEDGRAESAPQLTASVPQYAHEGKEVRRSERQWRSCGLLRSSWLMELMRPLRSLDSLRNLNSIV